MGHIIAITNHKGGVAKTTTTISLGAALAREKRKVLLIDSDIQCNTTSTLLHGAVVKGSLYNVLNQGNGEFSVQKCIHGTRYANLYVLPNVNETAALESILLRLPFDESVVVLRNRIRAYVEENFDYALIDCPPNLGFFVLNAMYASDLVIVPTEAGSLFSMDGLQESVQFVNDVSENGNPDLRLMKILMTKVDKRLTTHRAGVSQLEEMFPAEKVFKTFIPINIDLQKAELMKKTIFHYLAYSPGGRAYKSLAKEVISTLENIDG